MAGLDRNREAGKMVALATIVIQMVAKATSFPEGAAGSVLAHDKKCANSLKKNTVEYPESILRATESVRDHAIECGEGIFQRLSFIVAKIMASLVFVEYPQKRAHICNDLGP